jgi:hypothetical protein
MKSKIVIVIVSVFVSIFVLAFIALFTPFGSNKIIKPIVNTKLKQKVKDVDIKVTKLDSKYRYIDADAVVNKTINANAKGSIGYFSKEFNIDYRVDANDVKIKDDYYKLNLNIAGKAAGDADNFKVIGKGKAFGSDVAYALLVKNSLPRSIKATLNRARLSEIFLLAKVAPIIDGVASVNISMPSLDIKNPSGNGTIKIENGKFNSNLLLKAYKIKLPDNEKLAANLDLKVANKKVVGSGDINTTTIKLKIKKLISTLDFKITKAYIDAKIANLSRLAPILKQKLRGSLAVDGVVYSNMHKKITQASLKSKSFKGLLKIFYSNNSLKLSLNKVSIVKLEKTLVQPLYITSGVISGIVKIADLKKLNGEFNLQSSGKINRKIFKFKLPSYNYNIYTNGKLKDGTLYLNSAKLKSAFVNLVLKNAKYALATSALTSDFSLIINNLSAVNKFAKTNLRGSLRVDGKVAKVGDIINVDASTKSLGGNLDINYNGDKLKAKFKNISVAKVLKDANFPPIIKKGYATGEATFYSIKKQNGVVTIATNALVDTKVVKKVYDLDLGSTFKYRAKSGEIFIKKGVVVAKSVNFESNLFNVNLSKVLYKINSGNFRSRYNLKVDNLAKLKPLLKESLKGSLKVSGVIEKDGKDMLITGVASKFGGNINFRLKNAVLNLDMAGISIEKALDMLNKPKVIDGVTLAKLKYNTKGKFGNFNATISQAKFLNSNLVENLKRYANFDLTKEVFNEVLIDGVINKEIIKFNLKTKSNNKKIKIVIKSGVIDTKAQTINAKVTVQYKGKDYNFKVRGPLSDPSFKLSFSGAVKEKVLEKIEDKLLKKSKIGKELDKIIPKELGILKDKPNENKQKEQNSKPQEQESLEEKAKQKAKEKAKELFKGLF